MFSHGNAALRSFMLKKKKCIIVVIHHRCFRCLFNFLKRKKAFRGKSKIETIEQRLQRPGALCMQGHARLQLDSFVLSDTVRNAVLGFIGGASLLRHCTSACRRRRRRRRRRRHRHYSCYVATATATTPRRFIYNVRILSPVGIKALTI